jgi:hypothetical protein
MDAGCIFSPFHPPLDILPLPCDLAAYPSEHVCRRLSCLPHNLSGKNLLSAAQVSQGKYNPPEKCMVGEALIAHSAGRSSHISSLNLSQSATREKLFPPAKLIIKSQCWLLCCARFFLCVMLNIGLRLRHRFPAQRRQFYFCFLYHWRESSKHTDGNADGIIFRGKFLGFFSRKILYRRKILNSCAVLLNILPCVLCVRTYKCNPSIYISYCL